MPAETTSIALHRFHNWGAISILNTGGKTVYMTAKQARQLAKDATRLARSLERETFAESSYGSAYIDASLIS